MPWTTYESPLGPLTLIATATGLRGVHFPGHAPYRAASDHGPAALTEAVGQLEQYFAGQRRGFELELDLAGTAFQRRVWQALQQLAYASTTTYGALARELDVTASGTVSPARKGRLGDRRHADADHRALPPRDRRRRPADRLPRRLERKRLLLDLEAGGGAPRTLHAGDQQQLALL